MQCSNRRKPHLFHLNHDKSHFSLSGATEKFNSLRNPRSSSFLTSRQLKKVKEAAENGTQGIPGVGEEDLNSNSALVLFSRQRNPNKTPSAVSPFIWQKSVGKGCLMASLQFLYGALVDSGVKTRPCSALQF